MEAFYFFGGLILVLIFGIGLIALGGYTLLKGFKKM